MSYINGIIIHRCDYVAYNYFTLGGAVYCYQCVCMSVCLYVCLLTYVKNRMSKSWNFLYILPVAVAQSFSDENAISYILQFCG